MDILTIAEVVALLSATAVCWYVIIVLVRLRRVLGEVERDAKEITTRTLPILDNTEYITARLKSVAETLDDQVLTVRDSIATVRKMAENIVELERRVQERIEGPLLDGISFAAAMVKGVRTFFDRIRS